MNLFFLKPITFHDVFITVQPQNQLQGVKKVPDPKQNYIGLMTEG